MKLCLRGIRVVLLVFMAFALGSSTTLLLLASLCVFNV